ncbi:MAG: transcription termination/antitermination protein NusG [Acholeplasmatales bacterium]|jgi:transcriptional antiterminator NusG|nr:transcription termination/antitermination protein NusG [Acholeplasmatales bacterium]MDD7395758.1 transcription termination/antitermination protein NusG [Acholeplasmatales bacterium]MDY4017140.1 transcription termination/antitermination protein NusG [Bacilli bacterium]HCX07546.1 transcription termination/antitermination factor NusG [Acholeplasmatales bacterium]
MYNNDDYDNERAWYVIQSYAGMEYAAKRNLERRIVSMNMEDYIFNVLIPEEIHYELKTNGEKKEVITNPYPGYIFVDMIVTDESWFVVRNTPMVTGFLGSSGGRAKPVPVPMHEMIPILKKSGVVVNVEAKFKVGDKVKVLSETFLGQEATVESIDMDNQMVTVLIDMFGRQTPNELRFDEVEPIKN